MLTNISISHLVQVGHLQYLNISPSSGRAPPGALRLSNPPRVDFLLPSLTIWPPEQDPEYETHTVVVRRAKSVFIHLSPDETFDVALPQTLWFYYEMSTSPLFWLRPLFICLTSQLYLWEYIWSSQQILTSLFGFLQIKAHSSKFNLIFRSHSVPESLRKFGLALNLLKRQCSEGVIGLVEVTYFDHLFQTIFFWLTHSVNLSHRQRIQDVSPAPIGRKRTF